MSSSFVYVHRTPPSPLEFTNIKCNLLKAEQKLSTVTAKVIAFRSKLQSICYPHDWKDVTYPDYGGEKSFFFIHRRGKNAPCRKCGKLSNFNFCD